MAQWSEQSSLASHICGPVSTSGVDTISGLNLLLVLSYLFRGFYTLLKNQHLLACVAGVETGRG